MNSKDYFSWRKNSTGDGVIIATDETQEWMLKWWWNNYRAHNQVPVTIFDLGMSNSARKWCKTIGAVSSFSLPEGWIKPKESISPKAIKEWESTYPGDLWTGRPKWFTKPFLLLRSPYERTVWMDLDCEVRGSILPLFDYCNGENGFSILSFPIEEIEVYNTGVIVSRNRAVIPKKWAEHTYSHNEKHFGDETILMEVIEKEGLKLTPHPLIYNWPTMIPQDGGTVIRHHVGKYAKIKILKEMHV